MYKNYKDENVISRIKEQHNIMVLIGNGFDISILQKYRDDKLISSYSKFYDFLCYKEFNHNNLLFKKMNSDKEKKKENWSDFEESISELLSESCQREEIYDALKEMQNMFLLFLNELVTPEILLKLNDDILNSHWGITALSQFLGDLDKESFEKIEFPQKTDHYHMLNYLFINFNYTSLFDNYIHLDRYGFEPHPYKTVDTNFTFIPNPNGYNKVGSDDGTKWSSFIMTDVIHPHGYQNIPRSLLFGIEDDPKTPGSKHTIFNKSYWAQCNQKYKSYFKDTELFIIYGMSIGKSDSWWWDNIYQSLLNEKSELIIFFFDKDDTYSHESIKDRFISACNVISDEKEKSKAKERIYIVKYNAKTNLKMFGFGDI